MNVDERCGDNILKVISEQYYTKKMLLSQAFDVIINVVEKVKEFFTALHNYVTSRN